MQRPMPTKSPTLPMANDGCFCGMFDFKFGAFVFSWILFGTILLVASQLMPEERIAALMLLPVPMLGITAYLTNNYFFYVPVIFVMFVAAVFAGSFCLSFLIFATIQQNEQIKQFLIYSSTIHEKIQESSWTVCFATFLASLTFLWIFHVYLKAFKLTRDLASPKKVADHSKGTVCHGPVINIESLDLEFNRTDRHRF
uniref:Uncharacterized protein n=1 Tax=Panagrolaimus sp. JU765 TaxID=591449 RepID=A0AC34RNJ3_9BILA